MKPSEICTPGNLLNQDEVCRRFEKALQNEFLNLHDLYHHASAIRSACGTVRDASELQAEFEKRDKRGEFYDKAYRNKEMQKVEAAREKAQAAKRTLEKIGSKVTFPLAEVTCNDIAAPPVAIVLKSYQDEMTTNVQAFEPEIRPQKGYTKDDIRKSVKDVLDEVFRVLNKMLPEEQAAPIRDAIIKRFTYK